MNKTIKDALAKGKVLREERDQKLAEEARQAQAKKEAKAAEEKAKLEAEAERYMTYVPESLAQAVAKRETSFTLMTFESDKGERFSALAKLIEPKLKKMGLQFKHTNSTSWVQMTYDPDTGYEGRYYHLEVIVPEEAL